MKQIRTHWSAIILATAVILLAGLGPQAHAQAHNSQVSNGPAHEATLAPNSVSQMFSRTPAPADLGYLGVEITKVSAQQARLAKLPKPGGVYVLRVEPASPAAKAGIKAHDVIVGYHEHPVTGVLQFRRLVRETPPGRLVKIVVYRDGSERTLSAQIASPPVSLGRHMPNLQNKMRNMPPKGPSMAMKQPSTHPLLGVRAMEIQGQLARYFQVPGGHGVLVISVEPASAAEKAGLKAGDVIYQVEGKDVQSARQLEEALRSDCSASGVSLAIVRKAVTLVVNAEIKCPASTSTSSGPSGPSVAGK